MSDYQYMTVNREKERIYFDEAKINEDRRINGAFSVEYKLRRDIVQELFASKEIDVSNVTFGGFLKYSSSGSYYFTLRGSVVYFADYGSGWKNEFKKRSLRWRTSNKEQPYFRIDDIIEMASELQSLYTNWKEKNEIQRSKLAEHKMKMEEIREKIELQDRDSIQGYLDSEECTLTLRFKNYKELGTAYNLIRNVLNNG